MSTAKGDTTAKGFSHGGGVLFLHAHPDDEAIFTGGTLCRLADAGVPTTVVFATDGAPSRAHPLAAVRRAEAVAACALLGVGRTEFLGYGDSGLYGESGAAEALCAAPLVDVASRVAALVQASGAAAVVTYDEGGIYGHPDHLVVHRVGEWLRAEGSVPTVYEATVDREYLHFVETHLVGHAVNSLLGMEVSALNTAPLGVPTVEVSLTVDVRAQDATKRAAMAVHESQISSDSEALTMPPATFVGVYGFEWFVRRGPAGPLDRLAY